MKSEPDTKRPDFEKAQNAATDLLLQQNLTSLFIDVRRFKFDRRIIIDSIQHFALVTGHPVSDFSCDEFSGCCVIKHPRCNVILYDLLETNDFRKHWGIAHEVGHIYLEHDQDGEIEEIEAHFFVAQITMPEIILQNIWSRTGDLSPIDISGVFNASIDAAVKRLNTFCRRQRFNCGERDKELLRRLNPLIEEVYPPQPESQFWTRILMA